MISLEQLAANSKRPQARLHALCTLDGLRILRPETVVKFHSDEHPAVRAHAVRLTEQCFAEPRDTKPGNLRYDVLTPLANDPDPRVRMQTAYSLGASRYPEAGQLLAQIALRDSDDPFITAAALSSIRVENVAEFLTVVLGNQPAAPRTKLIEQLFASAAAIGTPETIKTIVQQITTPHEGRYAAWQFSAAAELIDAGQRRGNLDQALDDDARKSVMRLFDAARTVVPSPASPEADRVAALRILGRGPDHVDADLETLASLLAPKNSFALQTAAVAALGKLKHEQIPALLTTGWHSHSPNLRGQILDVLLSRPEWTQALLSTMERGDVPPAQIDATRRQRLLSLKSDAARKLAGKLFSSSSEPSRQKVLDDYKTVLTLAGDVGRGKQTFGKRCAVCHRFDGAGHAVGPDLAAVAGKTTDVLLAAMLDPNRAIEDRYRNYIVVTDDGQILAGMLGAETGASITLLAQEGKTTTVLRSQIEELRSSGKSLMPDGFEKDMAPQDFADVIAYLRSSGPPPKPFPGNKPETVRAGDDGALRLLATTARIHGPKIVFEEQYRNLGYWSSPDDYAVWSIEVPAAGEYRVVLDYACDNSAAGDKFLLTVGGQTIGGAVEGTGSWDVYRTKEIGIVKLPAGPAELVVRSDGPIKTALLDLRGVRLMPVKK